MGSVSLPGYQSRLPQRCPPRRWSIRDQLISPLFTPAFFSIFGRDPSSAILRPLHLVNQQMLNNVPNNTVRVNPSGPGLLAFRQTGLS